MVTDPYSVLGVSKDASKDEIKKAYRKKAKEYHPDLHPDDPKASEKMNEINEAYDMLNNPEKYQQREQQNTYSNRGYYQGGQKDPFEEFFGFGGYGAYGNRSAGPTNPTPHPNDSNDIRQVIDFINMRQYGYARQILNSIVSAQRDARWYYLSAITHYGQGNQLQANEEIQKAMQMDPGNTTYSSAYQRMQQTGNAYRQAAEGFEQYAQGMQRMCFSFIFMQFLCMFCRC